MSASRLHDIWFRYVGELLPGERITRVCNLTWLIVGLYLSHSVHLSRVAAKLPFRVTLCAAVQRLSRFLQNSAFRVRVWYRPKCQFCRPHIDHRRAELADAQAWLAEAALRPDTPGRWREQDGRRPSVAHRHCRQSPPCLADCLDVGQRFSRTSWRLSPTGLVTLRLYPPPRRGQRAAGGRLRVRCGSCLAAVARTALVLCPAPEGRFTGLC